MTDSTPTTAAGLERRDAETQTAFALRVIREETRQALRREIADRLRSQPWENALPIADAIEKDEWDV